MRLLRLIWHVTFGKVFWFLYAPKNIADTSFTDELNTELQEIEDHRYKIVKAKNCTIFTNQVDNITFSVHKELIPDISWQFEKGKVLKDSDNKLLSGEIRPGSPPKKINGTVVSLLTGGGGNYNYYHWLFDVLPRLKLCESVINDSSNIRYLVPANHSPFQKATLKILNISESQQISSTDINHLTCETAIATSHPNPDFNHVPNWIISYLREKFLHLARPSQESQRIYISRKDYTNKRVLKNEDELINMLEPFGFKTYQLSELQFEEQVSLFNNAEMVVGLHGAGLTNISFCNEKTLVIELIADPEQPKMYKSIADHLNLNYESFYLSSNSPDQPTGLASLNAKDLDKLKRLIQSLIRSDESYL